MQIFPKRPLELVTIANDNCLLPRIFIQSALDLTFSIAGENVRTQTDPHDAFDRRRPKRILIGPDGHITRTGNPHIQKVCLGYIDPDGESHRLGSDFPEKMYIRFINIKSDDALDRFIQKTGFCIFPTVAELTDLYRIYSERKVKTPRVFVPHRNTDEKRNHDLMEIVRANKEFIATKQKELRSLVEQYENGTLRYDQLLWVNQQMENISGILNDGKHFIWDEIKEGSAKSGTAIEDKRPLEKVIGLEEIRGMHIVPALRAYGHYAYCCYEFFLDILEKNKVSVCESCERYFQPDRKGQFLCKEPSCVRSRNSKTKIKK